MKASRQQVLWSHRYKTLYVDVNAHLCKCASCVTRELFPNLCVYGLDVYWCATISLPPLSCFGQIPLAGVSLLAWSSSPPGVTWTPTSTGTAPLPSSSDLALGEMGRPITPPAAPGLEKDPSPPMGPRHRRRLCSMKTRISPRGKLVWHWPQVKRSCSPDALLRGLGVDSSGDGDPAPESWLASAAEIRRGR